MKQDDIRSKDNWLRRIQEGSWEPEILISGIVLYGLFNVYPLIGELNFFLENNSSRAFSDSTFNENLAAILKFANIILIIGFVSHLLFRSVWAAFVGLSYVYSEGIKYDELHYDERYLKHIKGSGNYTNQIKKLERICSTIFAISFMIFTWLIGLGFLACIIAIPISIIRATFPGFNNYGLINNGITLFFLLVFIDFVSLGLLKRVRYVSKIYYPIHRLAGWLTLSFLYKSIYYGLISNHKKWKVSVILLVFSIVALISVINLRSDGFTFGRTILLVPYDDDFKLDEGHYRNKVQDGIYSVYMHIEDYITEQNTLELFVVHRTTFEEKWITKACNYDSIKELPGINLDSLRFSCLNNFYDVELDDQPLEEGFMYLRNSVTGQDGLVSAIDIASIESGKHKLTLFYNYYVEEKDTIYHNQADELVFIKSQ